MQQLDSIFMALTMPNERQATMRLFRYAVLTFVAINFVVMLPVAGQFFGPEALTVPLREAGFAIFKPFNLLATPAIQPYYWIFYVLLYAGIAVGFSGRYTRPAMVLVWLMFTNLSNRSLDITNGGYHLINAMLFFLVMMGNPANCKSKDSKWGIVSNMLSNLGFAAARFQLCLMYATAGLYKLAGDSWLNGEALWFVLNIDALSHPVAKQFIQTNDIVFLWGSWFTLLYQLAFPTVIWFRKTRMWVLALGMLLHLAIAFVIGLMDFGFAMIACYFIFYPEATSSRLLSFVRRRRGESGRSSQVEGGN